MEDDKAGDESSYFIPLVTPRGIASSDSKKVEAHADNVNVQFQPVIDPSVPAVIDMLLSSYFLSHVGVP